MATTTIDIDSVLARLDQLQPGKRFRSAEDMAKIAAGARKARDRGAPWTEIVANLKEVGVAISVARLKRLVDEQVASAEQKSAQTQGSKA